MTNLHKTMPKENPQKKKGKIFLSLILVICLMTPLIYLASASNLKKSLTENISLTDQKAAAVSAAYNQLALEIIKDMDSSYSPIVFNEKVKEDLGEDHYNEIKKEIEYMVEEYNPDLERILYSPNLHYKATIKNKDTSKTLTSEKDFDNPSDNPAENLFVYTIKTDENGKVSYSGLNGCNITMSEVEQAMIGGSSVTDMILESFPVSDKEDEENIAEGYIGYEDNEPYISYSTSEQRKAEMLANQLYDLKLPANFEIQFYYPKKPLAATDQITGIMSQLDESSTDDWQILIGAILLAAMAILFAICLLVPYSTEIASGSLVSSYMNWKLALVLIVGVGCALGLGAMGCNALYHLFRYENPFFIANESLKNNINWLVYIGSMLSIAFGLFMGSLDTIYLKSIFKKGWKNFYRENTLLYLLVCSIKKEADRLERSSLDKGMKKSVLFYLGINGIIFFLLMMITNADGGGVIVLILIFLAVNYFIFCKKYTDIQKDYQLVIQASEYLEDGDFDSLKEQPVGPFQGLYNNLLNVRSGFEEAVKEAVKSQSLKQELLTNVSHDLKTPMTGIKNYTELIAQSDDPEEIKAYALKVSEYSDRMDRLIVDLFDVSKAASGNIEVELIDLDLKELLDQVYSENKEKLERAGLETIFDVPPMPVMVKADPNKTMRIFDNLFSNAAKYSLAGTRLYIDLKEEHGKTVLQMKNISAYPLKVNTKELKERFVRADESRSQPGSGLGLAIVDSFMILQNGTLDLVNDGDLFKAILTFKK